MAENEQERSERATPKRREDARKKGQVARSQEITSAALILGAVGGLTVMGPSALRDMRALMTTLLNANPAAAMSQADVYAALMHALSATLVLVAPVMAWFAALGIVSVVAQPGLVWSATPLAPEWSRISPLSGFKRLFSLQSAAVSLKTLFKFGVIGWVSYLVVKDELPALTAAMTAEPSAGVGVMSSALLRLGLWSGGVIAVLAAADYGYQRWEFERNLRMSREDIKQEMKETEGDPWLKARIRALQRERATKRMMAEVPKADVVVTNPTELAVALLYRHGEMAAPKVVAKGAGLVAKRIRETAWRHGVPVMENKPLARALFKTTGVGEPIPSKLYRAAAEVLAYVYRVRRASRGASAMASRRAPEHGTDQ
ncbi:MAG: flagellar biosynthesis protein FlhB [Nitrospirota bacterium]